MDQRVHERGRSAAYPPGLREIAHGKLYALGSAFSIDGRISWLPADARGFQATRAYLLKEDDSYLLVDPGLMYQKDLLIRQLAAVVPPGSTISVFFTRSEPDCFGCLEDLFQHYDVEQVLTGGGHNPFDGFDQIMVSSNDSKMKYTPLSRAAKFTPIDMSPKRQPLVLNSVLRINSTFWLYDPGSEALMTSDAFSHSLGSTYDEALEIDYTGRDSPQHVKSHLFGKFWWMPFAHREDIVRRFLEVFETYSVRAICPGHGRPFVGDAAVKQVVSLMERALTENNQPRVESVSGA